MFSFRLPLFVALGMLLLSSCSTPPSTTTQSADSVSTARVGASSQDKLPAVGESRTTQTFSNGEHFTVATFNIQNFGPTKAAKPEVLSKLAEIIRKYDVVAVQEISDVSEQAPQKLLVAVNASGASYALLLSERTGKQANDASSQEQYAFYYNTTKVRARDSGMLYPDGAHDYFQREPFVAGFISGGQKFVLITIHTRPESAVAEIEALSHVIDWTRGHYPAEDDFITLGDFNAGGSYASRTKLDTIRKVDLPYLWVVPDSNDSTVATTTSAAYDRIVVTNGLAKNFHQRWGVDRSFTDKTISDHWPVWAEFDFSTNDK